MPLREVMKKYTKSEVAIMAWRSSEIGYNMSSRAIEGQVDRMLQQQPKSNVDSIYEEISPVKDAELAEIEKRLGPTIIAQMVDEKTGDINLGKLTGAQAMHFLSTMKINMGRA